MNFLKVPARLALVIPVILFIQVLSAQGQSGYCKPFNFDLPQRFDSGLGSTTLANADINADGIDDLITGDSTNKSVSVMLGTGTGTYGPPQSFATQVDVDVIDVRDINNDGKPDVVVGRQRPLSQVMLLINNGNAGFGAPQLVANINSADWLYDLKIADVNGDGSADIVAATSANVIVYRGNSQGGFGPGSSVAWNGQLAKLAIGDLNNDGLNDIAVTQGYATLQAFAIILGSSTNTFTISQTYSVEGEPTAIVIGMFNGDSLPDIAVAGYDDTFPFAAERLYVQPWIGSGGGTFAPGGRTAVPASPKGLITTDYNADGKADLVVDLESFVVQMAGIGDGSFAAPTVWRSAGSVAIVSADADGDGRNDILALRGRTPPQFSNLLPEQSMVSVIKTNPDGTLRAQRAFLDGGTFIVAADMNSDGFADMITARASSAETSRVVLAMNDQNRGFLPEVWAGAGSNLSSLELANINNDGKPDLFTTHSPYIAGYLGNGAGGLITMSPPPIGVPSNQIGTVVPADFNGDGKEDVIFSQFPDSHVWLGNGNGTYQNLNYSPGSFDKPVVGDFNKDGKIDLVGYDHQVAGLQVFLGNGDGRFTVGASFPAASGFETYVKGDFNGDGNLDVAGITPTGNPSVTVISKFFGDGAGGFTNSAVTTLNTNTLTRSLIAADFNGDSLDDLAFLNYGPEGSIGVLASVAQAPYFGQIRFYSVGGLAAGSFVYGSRSLVAADYNNDGRIDIGYTEQDVSRGVLFNNSDPAMPCMSIDDATVTETEGTQTATFTVSLTQPSVSVVSVNYAVRGQTATIGTDLQNRYGRLEIPAGQTSATLSIPIEGDLLDESDEDFRVELSGVSNAFLVKSTGQGRILDNDDQPSFGISDIELTEVAGSQQAVFNIQLSAPSGKPITFRYSTTNGSATSGSDYSGGSFVKTIPAGTSTTTISVQIFTDTMHELTEDFFVNLSEPSNVTITNAQAKVTIFDNDPVPTFTITAGSVFEPDTGFFVNRTVTLRLSNPTYLPVTGNTRTSDGTATAGADYAEFIAPFSFSPGVTQLVGQVPILGDTLDERNETFFMNVSDLSNAEAGSAQAQITILDDEPTAFDYDGDSLSDISVRRPSDNTWYLLRGTAGYTAMEFGVEGDLISPVDYDGDQKADIAVFRPSTGSWYVFMSQTQTFQVISWGQNGDLPIPADRDGDRRADLVLFRPSTNTWYTRFASGTYATTTFGATGDKPVAGDFDGDGKADIALYRPSDSNWYILKTGFGFFVQTWGEAGDIPVPADYDGDGKTDVAVFRPLTGQWFRIRSTAGFDTVNWGANGDKPIPADYDGDGKGDVAVFRPSNNNWYIVGSTSGQLIQQYGIAGDIPTEGAFIY